MTEPTCKHCGAVRMYRRGLCRSCYATPGVREQYPSGRVKLNFGPMCRHCQRAKINRPRGLCWCCYYRPDVRDLYPAAVVRGEGLQGDSVRDPEPTAALPGTEERLRILAERVARKESLFHSQDSRRG